MFFVWTEADCNGAEAHFFGVLHAEMPQTTNALDSDGIACTSGVAERIERRDAGANQRGRIFRFELFRYESQCACLCDHHFRIAAIIRHASDNGVLAICRVAAATGLAGSVFTSKEPDSYTLADLPGRNPPANLLDAANCFVARHTRTDPGTCLTWTLEDSRTDVNWSQAASYCNHLRLGGYSDWRLPTIDELRTINDNNVNTPGNMGDNGPVTWHVKGSIQLSGSAHWSSTSGNT